MKFPKHFSIFILFSKKSASMSYASPDVEAFHKAVFRGKKKEVKVVLNEAVAIGTRSDGISALHIVASTGSTRICKLLLPFFKSGPNSALEQRESHGATALCIAAQNGHAGVCKLLLESGADPNAARADHVTPLYIAAQEGHSKIVQVLLQNRANVGFQAKGKRGKEKTLNLSNTLLQVFLTNAKETFWCFCSVCRCSKGPRQSGGAVSGLGSSGQRFR